jgi:glycine/serine hydroxymethyltransferase
MGSPAVTSRGLGTEEMRQIAGWVGKVCQSLKAQGGDAKTLPAEIVESITRDVKALCARFPIYR